jgi:hypothetical protein
LWSDRRKLGANQRPTCSHLGVTLEGGWRVAQHPTQGGERRWWRVARAPVVLAIGGALIVVSPSSPETSRMQS